MSRIQRPLRPAYVFSMWCDDHDDPALICHVTTRMWNDVNKQNNGKHSVPQTQNAVFWVFFSRVPLRRKMHSLSAAVVICLCTVSASVLADESSDNNTTTKTTTTTTTTQKTTLTSTTENVEDGLFLIVLCLLTTLFCAITDERTTATTTVLRPLHPIQSNANKREMVFLFASVVNNITYKLKHLQFQLTRSENCERLD